MNVIASVIAAGLIQGFELGRFPRVLVELGDADQRQALGNGIFGNILDPNSEIRYVLENKAVFRLKEDLGTEPKFWYFSDR